MLRLPALLTVLMLSLLFSACETETGKIHITLESDYSQIIQAINDANNSLTQKLALIESAFANGFTNSEEAQVLIQKALNSLSGTMAEKLAAIETAIKDQTASLETKLALIEAAVAGGFADEAAQQALIKMAIESLTGTQIFLTAAAVGEDILSHFEERKIFEIRDGKILPYSE